MKETKSITNCSRLRRIRTESRYVYADVELKMGTKDCDPLDESTFNMILRSAMKSAHGDKGLAVDVDILKFDSSLNGTGSAPSNTINARAYLRIPATHLVVVRSSLTLLTHYDGNHCTINFLKLCHSLSSLPLESRNCVYNVVN